MRLAQIQQAAVDLAARIGVFNLTRSLIAREADVSPALISHYLGTSAETVDRVMLEAVKQSVVSIVSQGLAMGHPIAASAPQQLKDLAAAHIAA